MPVLHLDEVPSEVYERLSQLAAVHERTPEAEAVNLLRQELINQPAGVSQAALLAGMRRRSFTPPPAAPDSVELLREDRAR